MNSGPNFRIHKGSLYKVVMFKQITTRFSESNVNHMNILWRQKSVYVFIYLVSSLVVV